MTRIIGNYVVGEVQLRINSRMEALKTESDEALEIKVRNGLRCADRRDSTVNLLGSATPLGFWELVVAPVEFYDGMVAIRLLGERRGENYALGLVGYRRPETFLEKARYFFTRNLPETDHRNCEVNKRNCEVNKRNCEVNIIK